jgi:hypothetical protein
MAEGGNVKLPRYSWGELGKDASIPGYAHESVSRKETKVDWMKKADSEFKQSSDAGGSPKPSDGFVDGTLDKKYAYNMKEKW